MIIENSLRWLVACTLIITRTSPGHFFKMAASHFVQVTDKEINCFKENAYFWNNHLCDYIKPLFTLPVLFCRPLIISASHFSSIEIFGTVLSKKPTPSVVGGQGIFRVYDIFIYFIFCRLSLFSTYFISDLNVWLTNWMFEFNICEFKLQDRMLELKVWI